MTERERRIQSCIDHIKTSVDIDPWAAELAIKALELMKAQEPRVMTLEEIWERGDNEPLFLEYKLLDKTKLVPAVFQLDNLDYGGGDGYMCVVSAWYASGLYNQREYNIDWRCWTSCPTDEQRRKTPWRD